ncbi:MAG: rhodanese-like domain-containing protein [Betaproteobacteria bacterium]
MSSHLVGVHDLLAALERPGPPVLLDVRDLAESERGHAAGATILPRRRLEFRIDALVRDRATPIVAIDSGDDDGTGRRDSRAALASATLRALGYARAAALDGGMVAWRDAGLPEVHGAQGASQAFGRRIGDLRRVPTVTVAALLRWKAEGRRVALCDVRTAAEHTEGCVPGAVALPGFEVALHALDMGAESDVIVLCSSARTRGVLAARTLIGLGLGDVVALDGGTLAWRLAGQALEHGSHRRRIAPSTAALQFAELAAARLAKHVGVGSVEAADLAATLAAPAANLHLFDLRDAACHADGHVPHSIAVPCDALLVRNEEWLAARATPVVLVDDVEVRALLAGVWLRRLGYADVAVLAGGHAAWARDGRRLASGRSPPLGWQDVQARAPALQPGEVAGWLASHPGACLLHVDTSASWRRGHLPDAAWLQRGWLEARIGLVAPHHSLPLLLTCVEGAQAAYAAATLRERGYEQVAWLDGGTRAWAAAGHVLVTSALPLQDDELLLPARRDAQAMGDYLQAPS